MSSLFYIYLFLKSSSQLLFYNLIVTMCFLCHLRQNRKPKSYFKAFLYLLESTFCLMMMDFVPKPQLIHWSKLIIACFCFCSGQIPWGIWQVQSPVHPPQRGWGWSQHRKVPQSWEAQHWCKCWVWTCFPDKALQPLKESTCLDPDIQHCHVLLAGWSIC